ncbi:MAG: 2OG-Fe(II) oxygenase family protein [Gammaproteobacteria bacterium]
MNAGADGWMESSDVLSLFPTLVWKILLVAEVRQDIDTSVREVLEFARRESTALGHGEAWQSERNLHELPGLSGLLVCIDRASRSAMRSLRINYDAFEITGCWANISAPGASHGMHSHPNNFLSGVYYLQTRADADTVNFHDPRSQSGIIRPPVTELTRENTDQVVVTVNDGTLLIFPSYLQHSVEPNGSEEPRISVSFNIMFSAFAENLSKPLW